MRPFFNFAAGLSIALASRLAVASRGLGTASPSRVLARYGSGVRFQGGSVYDTSFPQRSNATLFSLAAGLGIEPKFSLSESDVLPLDDPAMYMCFQGNHLTILEKAKIFKPTDDLTVSACI